MPRLRPSAWVLLYEGKALWESPFSGEGGSSWDRLTVWRALCIVLSDVIRV